MVVGSEFPTAASGATAAGAPGGDSSMGGGAAAQPSPVTPMRRRIEIVTPARGGISPVATKARLHETAVEPDSIERELSLSEVTYSLWQLKAQQMNDHQWFLQATAAMDNHAATLDRQAISIIKLRGAQASDRDVGQSGRRSAQESRHVASWACCGGGHPHERSH